MTAGLPAPKPLPVEREEVSGAFGELGGEPRGVGIHGEVDQRSLFPTEDWGFGVPVFLVLLLSVGSGLAGEGVLQFGGDHGDAVQEEDQV